MMEPVIGILEWLRPGEHERVERVLADLRTLGITELRTGVSWADSYTPEGEKWYDWLLPRLAREIDVLPCFMYTPPSLGVVPKSSSPPRDPKAYADFIDVMITRYGEHFDWIEFWNEPNNLSEWDWSLDPAWRIFCEMVGGAAYWAKQRGKKTVLGGVSPIDPNWVRLMCEYGVVQYMDAVGVHAFPATFETGWDGWAANIAKVREVLDRYGSTAEIWITETGYSTWRHDERRQLAAFLNTIKAPAERVYWYASYDLEPAVPTHDGLYSDMREYHFGLKYTDGTPKLLFTLWANGGLEAVWDAAWLCEPAHLLSHEERPVLITGGAGFVGTNLAHRLLESGQSVLVLDNLSRPGVDQNLCWLRKTHGNRVQIEVADVRDWYALHRAVQCAGQVFHFAAQVAVTTSLTKPVYDFEINARGTLNLLEALRTLKDPPPLVFTSTNKVYGALKDILLSENATRYEPEDPLIGVNGISEDHELDFLSPYGCSKGAAEQYILEYARTFAIPAVVFRMSCIYGPHQFGIADQGWVVHFGSRAIEGKPITVYGNGKQVRDVLFVDDLVNAFLLAQQNMQALAGQLFNIGGGPANTTSLLEFIDLIAAIHGQKPPVYFDEWRLGDQRYYVSDTSKFHAATGWSPQVGIHEGVKRSYQWLREHHGVSSGRLAVEKGCDGRSNPAPRAVATGTRIAPRAALTGEDTGRLHHRLGELGADAMTERPVITAKQTAAMTMRAAVIAKPQTIRLDEMAVPEPGPTEVRVRLEGCGVCGSDLPVWEGQPWFAYPLAPGAPGHEGWGRIDAVGRDVTGLAIGDRVAMLSSRAYAEYDIAAANSVMRLPAFMEGKPFPGEPLGCAMNIFRRSEIRPGQTVAIIGIGFLGALLTRLASQAGARVIAISRRSFAFEVARELGAAESILLNDHWRIIEQVKAMTGGKGCERVIEAVGKQWPLDLAAELTRERGRLVIAGYHQDGPRQVNMQLWNWRGLDVINAHERDPNVYLEGMRAVVDAIGEGKLDPSALYTHTFGLDQITEAFEAMRNRPYGFLKALVIL